MSGDIPETHSLNILDEIRQNEGVDKLKAYLKALLEKNKDEAVKLINEENLHFSTLFALQDEMKKYNLYKHLSPRNSNALETAERILARKPSNVRSMPQASKQATYYSLRWIVDTQSDNDDKDKRLEEVVDTAALLLIKSYKDKTVLPAVVNMMFDRHSRDAHTYDLIWACFESRDPQILLMLANRLLSPRKKDSELAANLLSFVPCPGMKDDMDRFQHYTCCINWINENYPFLYYTGESLQQSCKPIPFAVSWEGKYLCRTVSADNGKIYAPLTKDELTLLGIFEGLDNHTKVLLSNCSFRLYRNNYHRWYRWIHLPIWQQIQYASRIGGGLL